MIFNIACIVPSVWYKDMHATCWTIRMWVSGRDEVSEWARAVINSPVYTGFKLNSVRPSLPRSPSHNNWGGIGSFHERLTQDYCGPKPGRMHHWLGSQALYQCATSPASGKTYFTLLLGGQHSILEGGGDLGILNWINYLFHLLSAIFHLFHNLPQGFFFFLFTKLDHRLGLALMWGLRWRAKRGFTNWSVLMMPS